MNIITGKFENDVLQVAPLRLTPDQTAEFISGIYDCYDHGSSFVPRWSGAFLKHVVFDHPDFTPDHALGAYCGDKLVGLVLAQPHHVMFGSDPQKGAYASWLAVSPEGARQFAAVKLIHELRERLRQRGAQFIVGIAYPSGPDVGLAFWQRFSKCFSKDITIGPKLGFWTRVLDASALADAITHPALSLAARSGHLRPVRDPGTDNNIRDYCLDDLADCRDLMAEMPGRMRTMPTAWELTCAPSLDTGPQTMVIKGDDGVTALALFHIVPMEDKGPMRIAIIEHLFARPGTKGIGPLLRAVLWRLKAAGACLVLLPRKPHLSTAFMIGSGFVPYGGGFRMIYLPLGFQAPPQMPPSFDLLVR